MLCLAKKAVLYPEIQPYQKYNSVKLPRMWKLTGETFEQRIANTSDNARLNTSARGFWTKYQMAFFDVRIFDPSSKRYSTISIQRCYITNEKAWWRNGKGSIKTLLANRWNVVQKTRRTLLDNNVLDSEETIVFLNEIDHYVH